MNPRSSLPRFLLQCVVVGLAAAFVIGLLMPDAGPRLRARLGLSEPVPATDTAVPVRPGASIAPASYADAVQRAAPSVVSVYVNKLITERPILIPNPTVQRFSGITLGSPRQRLQRAQGSGVLVSSDGYILTNHHVVAGANDIQIVLWDGRVTAAHIVGSDRDTDLAVLKIDGSHLPAMPLDHDTPLRVGDVALAIGNPFGLGQTVTQGIVSGLARSQALLGGTENAQTFPAVDFIQTDAAINAGNSGGALVDAHGTLIGINTFVLGRMSMDAEGIGFAIPARTAREVLAQIVEHGTVIRGWLGAEYVDTPALPGALPTDTPRGVVLSALYTNGPAAQAGLRPGDVLLGLNGADIIDQFDLRNREAALAPGTDIVLTGLRAGVPFEAKLQLVQRPTSRPG
ncbi:trypsin-like peptidase domain-containing protein [Xanthomonadaceae bacterium XH05]|nr:trypsin-like peptidase domain-containing protein [Xanthomonadaceae bacterium XH05]